MLLLPCWGRSPATARYPAGAGASLPTKGCLLVSKTGPAAGATAVPRLYSLGPIRPILAPRRCPGTGASKGAPGAAALGAQQSAVPRQGLGRGKPDGNRAGRSAHPHGGEEPAPAAFISPHTTLGAVYHSGSGSVLFLFGFASECRKRPRCAARPLCRWAGGAHRDTAPNPSPPPARGQRRGLGRAGRCWDL